MLLFGAAPAFAEVAVTEADDGGSVEVASGDTLTLAVRTNGGIPYIWKITSNVAPQLSLEGQETVADTPGLPGGGARVVFTFTAAEAGETTLTAGLMPVTGGEAARSVSITVTVTE